MAILSMVHPLPLEGNRAYHLPPLPTFAALAALAALSKLQAW